MSAGPTPWTRAGPREMSDAETTVLYALSTLAQTCAALAAFVGAVGVFRLQVLATRRRQLEDDLRGWRAQLGSQIDVRVLTMEQIVAEIEATPHGRTTEAKLIAA